jgi:hypothetical protein
MGDDGVNSYVSEVTMDEIAKGLVETLKETHGDGAHFYILEQLILTDDKPHLVNENKVWRRVLNTIQNERNE